MIPALIVLAGEVWSHRPSANCQLHNVEPTECTSSRNSGHALISQLDATVLPNSLYRSSVDATGLVLGQS